VHSYSRRVLRRWPLQ